MKHQLAFYKKGKGQVTKASSVTSHRDVRRGIQPCAESPMLCSKSRTRTCKNQCWPL